MNKLPKIKKTAIPPVQRQFLKKWLAMRAFDNQWGDLAPEEHTEPSSPPQEDILPTFKTSDFDNNLQIGDIRLPEPSLLPDALVPRYLAIISEWDDGLFLVAPFAPYSVPAVRGELLTEHEHFSLAVLQLWNAVVAPPSILARSLFTDKLSTTEIENAEATFRHIMAGTSLPETLIERVGPPIINPEDPRLEYQKQETQTWSYFRQRCLKAIEKEEDRKTEKEIFINICSQLMLISSQKRKMAASHTDTERPLSSCRLASREPFVVIELNECVNPENVALEVKEDPLNVMPQAEILTADGEKIGEFSDQGTAVCKIQPDGLIAIRLKTGETLVLEKETQ